VIEVRTGILTNSALESAVARALDADARTHGQAVGVRALLGRVELLGEVDSPGIASAADRVAAGVPGVVAVRTYLALAPPQASESSTRA
jgi:osmotically-inducible protein OsmY